MAHINLNHLRRLEDNWDKDGAKAPTDEALDLAERILNTPGKATAQHNGGVRIEWHAETTHIVWNIAPDGTLEYSKWD